MSREVGRRHTGLQRRRAEGGSGFLFVRVGLTVNHVRAHVGCVGGVPSVRRRRGMKAAFFAVDGGPVLTGWGGAELDLRGGQSREGGEVRAR